MAEWQGVHRIVEPGELRLKRGAHNLMTMVSLRTQGNMTKEKRERRERVNERDYVTMSILVDRSQAVRIVV